MNIMQKELTQLDDCDKSYASNNQQRLKLSSTICFIFSKLNYIFKRTLKKVRSYIQIEDDWIKNLTKK